MDNTCTLGQFITECENFKYSKEYFEMLKECMEIKLAEQYIESCNYIKEHESLLESFNGYFCEADSKSDTDANIDAKKENLFKRFITWVKNLLIKFKNGIVNLWNKIFKKNNKAVEEKINKFVKELSNTPDKFVMVDQAIKAADEIISKYEYVYGLQLTKITDYKYDGFIKEKDKEKFYYLMTLAFENNLYIKRHIGGKENIFLVTYDEYIDLFNELLKIEDYKTFYKKYSNFKGDMNPIELSLDQKSIQKFTEELNRSISIIDSIKAGNKLVKAFTDSEMEVVALFSSMTAILLKALTQIGQCKEELQTTLEKIFEEAHNKINNTKEEKHNA